MNKAVLLGRLVADPELKKTNSGLSVTSFVIAVDRKGTKGDNKITDWIDVVAWRNTAEFICKYFRKGSPIIIDGAIQTRTWEDNDGKKHKAVEVLADSVEFVPGNKKAEAGQVVPNTMTTATPDFCTPQPDVFPAPDGYTLVDDEDLPF